MKELIEQVKKEVNNEYQRAVEAYGAKHNSSHEAYSVIREEMEEAFEELQEFTETMSLYWEAVRNNDKTLQALHLDALYKRAVYGAAELIQTAAMIQKAQQGYERDKE